MRDTHVFEGRVLKWVISQRMINRNDRILVAVSGGPDSVAMLRLLRSWQVSMELNLRVVHFNHGLRGEESERDAESVEVLGRSLGLPVIHQRLHLPERSERKGKSLQMVAREERYKALAHLADFYGADKIALGHILDDQAETVLLWMLRGAGSNGLAGIPPVRGSKFIRPLLQSSRQEILEYLAVNQVSYREDSSNKTPVYLRNRVRNEIIPLLKRFNPNILEVLSRQADILREETRYLDERAGEAFAAVTESRLPQEIRLNRDSFQGLSRALQRRVVVKIFQHLSEQDSPPRYDTIEEVLEKVVAGQSGASTCRNNIWVIREYSLIRFVSMTHHSGATDHSWIATLAFAIPSTVLWPLTGQFIAGCLGSCEGKNIVFGDRFQAFFDAHSFSNNLVIRTWKPGDVFHPFGFHGKRKKVQDFFSDMKLSPEKRRRVPLIVSPEGILWVGGYRSDERFRVTPSTRKIFKTSISPESE